MKRMLINATQKEELRVALVDGQRLYDIDTERKGAGKKKANIYKGIITRVERSLEAAFVNFGSNRHGFLPIKEVARSYFGSSHNFDRGRPHIKDALKQGQEVIVQVEIEERGTKGAALTTFISLAGCYLVLMPNNPRAGGISRRIEGEEREQLQEAINQLDVPEGMGLIVRTAGVGRSISELQWDLKYLLSQWKQIQEASVQQEAPFLIYQESDVILRAIRDNLRPEIQEIIIDHPKAYERARETIQYLRPEFSSKIKLHDKAIPLFNLYQIETQIESAYDRVVPLANGGAIVIDPTEAMISIDINSAKATEGGDIEETALNTNLAATKEIARQLRLRDIGGLIVIDFIDMNSVRNQRMVENQMREELKADRARIQVGRISKFGLLEMSRQRLRPSLGEATQVTCPRCDGQGTIRGIQSLGFAVMRALEEEAMRTRMGRVDAHVPLEVASFLLNEKRNAISKIEQRQKVQVFIIPSAHLQTPRYEIETIESGKEKISYSTAKPPEDEGLKVPFSPHHESEDEPAIKAMSPSRHPFEQRDSGFIRRLWSAVFGREDKDPSSESPLPEASVNETQEKPKSPPQQGRSGQYKSRSNRGAKGQKSTQDNRNPEGRSSQRKSQRGQYQKGSSSGQNKRQGGHQGRENQKRAQSHLSRRRDQQGNRRQESAPQVAPSTEVSPPPSQDPQVMACAPAAMPQDTHPAPVARPSAAAPKAPSAPTHAPQTESSVPEQAANLACKAPVQDEVSPPQEETPIKRVPIKPQAPTAFEKKDPLTIQKTQLAQEHIYTPKQDIAKPPEQREYKDSLGFSSASFDKKIESTVQAPCEPTTMEPADATKLKQVVTQKENPQSASYEPKAKPDPLVEKTLEEDTDN